MKKQISTKRTNLYLNRDVLQRAKLYCAATDMSLTRFIEKSMIKNLPKTMDVAFEDKTIVSGSLPVDNQQ